MGKTKGIIQIAIHFKNAFRGLNNIIATVDGVFQISDSPIALSDLPIASSTQGAATLIPDTNLPGGDYKNFDLSSPDQTLCQQAYTNDPNCKAFTYVKPGYQGSNARCWLKNAVPGEVTNNCCTSGVEQQRTSS